jgi:hypothetical protein
MTIYVKVLFNLKIAYCMRTFLRISLVWWWAEHQIFDCLKIRIYVLVAIV